jgi:hypothetical protein
VAVALPQEDMPTAKITPENYAHLKFTASLVANIRTP